MLTDFQEDLKTMTLNDVLLKHNLTLNEAFYKLHKEWIREKGRQNLQKARRKRWDSNLEYNTANVDTNINSDGFIILECYSVS